MPISDNYGVVTKCYCSNPDLPEHCKSCMCRGFVAACLACSATGQTTVPVAGASSGEMRSTCSACGGTGKFAVRKPAEWDAEHAEPVEAAKVETEEEEDADFKAMVAGAETVVVAEETTLRLEAIQDAAGEYRKIEDTQAGKMVIGDIEPTSDGEIEAATDPIRPRSIHWKVWGKFTPEQRIAAVEAAKIETPELASV